MLNRKISEWSNEACRYVDKGRVTEHVGRSVYVASEVVRVMSDVYEDHYFLYSIRDDGTLSRDCIGGWEGQKPEDLPDYAIDATDEAFELYRAHVESKRFDECVNATNADYANPAFKGRVVKVVKGRNAPVGKVGKVVAIIQRPYGMGYRSVLKNKLGIALSPKMVDKVMPNGKVFKNYADMIWVWEHNCEVENPETADLDLCRQNAKRFANQAVESLRKCQENANKWHEGLMRGRRLAA